MARIVREKSFYKNLLFLTLPIALQNIITYLVTLADNIMVGSLGETTLSGVYMANQVMSFIQMTPEEAQSWKPKAILLSDNNSKAEMI